MERKLELIYQEDSRKFFVNEIRSSIIVSKICYNYIYKAYIRRFIFDEDCYR